MIHEPSYYGVVDNGLNIAAGFADMIEAEHDIIIPPGNYRLAPSAVFYLTRSVRIVSAPGVRFYSELTDAGAGMAFRPDASAYDPDRPINIDIEGGHFDLRNAPTGTGSGVPFVSAYPPVNPAATGATALYANGKVDLGGGVFKQAFHRVRYAGVTVQQCNWDADWRTSGGESPLHCRDARHAIVENCHLIGGRDSVYLTGDEDLAFDCAYTFRNNVVERAVLGPAIKRGLRGATVTNNKFWGVETCIVFTTLNGFQRTQGCIASDNRAENCTKFIEFKNVDDCAAHDNRIAKLGYRFPNGDYLAGGADARAFSLVGSNNCTIDGNSVYGANDGYKTTGRTSTFVAMEVTACIRNYVRDNNLKDISYYGGERTGAAHNYNAFIHNPTNGLGVGGVPTLVGANSVYQVAAV